MNQSEGSELVPVTGEYNTETSDESAVNKQAGNEERVVWDNKAQYILSLVGYAVGVGNVWRFPTLCHKYGGGAFLIPYFIMLLIEGLPLFYLEVSLGHRFHRGSIGTWRQVAPAFTGIGIAMSLSSFVVGCYYIIVMVWSFFYLFNSFHDPLPWMSCDNTTGNTTGMVIVNGSKVNLGDLCRDEGSSKFYWYNDAVQASSDIEHPGKMIWQLALCLLLGWVIVFVFLLKGIKSSGKAVYVTAVFPYVVLIALFFRGVTLEGAGTGLAFLFTPEWSKLYDPVVWLEAAAQIFFSLGVGFGAHITYTSYTDPNKKSDPLKDTVTVAFINCGTSVFASIVIFSILGFKAEQTKVDVKEVAGGPGLAFIAFSEGLGKMPGGPFWSVLFFLMLITLAIDSMFGQVEVPLTDILDELGHKQYITKFRVLLGICVSGLLVGLVFVTQSGYYTFQLFNTYSVSLPLLVTAVCECVAVAWIYGVERFGQDLEVITGKYPKRMWLYLWKYISPVVITLILIGSTIRQGINPINYHIYRDYEDSDDGEYPAWALTCAAFMISLIVLPIFVGVLLYYFRRWKVRRSYHMDKQNHVMVDIQSECPTYRSVDRSNSEG